MSRASVRKHVLEKSTTVGLNKEKDNPKVKNNSSSFFFRHFKKVYPLGIRRSNSLLSVSSLSGLSQTSTDSSLTDYCSCPLEQNILLSLESLIDRASSVSPPPESEETESPRVPHSPTIQLPYDHGVLKRCHWITKASHEVYVAFHDEQWGVPVYDDNQLFELLSLCGLLMDYNWTEILKRRWQLREAFRGFDVKLVANMGEEQVTEICSNKELGLAECRATCMIENAKGILKVAKEYGSFSSYIWDYFNYKPIINKHRYPRNVPLRTPKAEIISKDLVRRGFRLVGPVITQSFIQAAGMTIDHLVDCFRYSQCVSLAENPWKHV